MEDGIGFLRMQKACRMGWNAGEKNSPFGRCNFGDGNFGSRGAQLLIKIFVVSSDRLLMIFSRLDDVALASGGWEKTVESRAGFYRGIVLDFRMAFCTTNSVKSFFPEFD